jgi:hypothetical protein
MVTQTEELMAETEETTPSYRVKALGQTEAFLDAYLEPASEGDMPSINSTDWTFDWRSFWTKTDFGCEAIVKLSYQGEVLGLIRFGLYPYPFPGDAPEYLEILHLECVPRDRRLVNPVGFWLIWYALKIGLKYCVGDDDGILVRLDSVEEAIPYYRDKVKMEGLGWTDIAPGEQGYAFKFTKEGAEEFCRRLQQAYGFPVQLN